MFYRYLLLLLSILLPFTARAQRVSGTVQDSLAGTPLAYATVLRYGADTVLLDGTTTDESGRFALPDVPGGRWLQIAFVGYRDRKVVLPDTITTVIARLSPDGELLTTVEVRADRTRVRQLIDRRLIEVGEDLQTAGGDAASVLRLLPEVQMNGGDQLQLRGSGNVTVLINGKPSPVGTRDLLRSIPAGSLVRVEVITAPGARQRAEGIGGIINLITKQDRRRGLEANLNGSANSLGGYGFGGNATLGAPRFNLAGNLSYQQLDEYWWDELRREGFQPFDRRARVGMIGPHLTGELSLDYFPNDRNEWSVALAYFRNQHDHPYATELRTDAEAIQTGALVGHVHRNASVNLNWRRFFDEEKAHRLEVDARYARNTNDLDNRQTTPAGVETYQRTLEGNDLSDVAVDYVRPLGSGSLVALYFSRAPIPWRRDAREAGGFPEAFLHVGLYAYRCGYLLRYGALSPAPLEREEQLEQLRVLHHGGRIHVGEIAPDSGHGVDTPADVAAAERALDALARS